MEVDVSHRTAVGLGLRLGDGVVHPPGPAAHLLRQGQAVQKLPDVPRRGVVMMARTVVMGVIVVVVMSMVMVVGLSVAVDVGVGRLRGNGALRLLLAVDRHRHVGAGDAAGGGSLGLHPDAGQAQGVHGVQKRLLVLQKLIQGGHQHIPGGAHIAFNVKYFHFTLSALPSD